MPGIPLNNIGTALGGLTQGYQQSRDSDTLNQLRMAALAEALQKKKDQQQLQQALGAAWPAFLQSPGMMAGAPQTPMPGASSQPGSGGMSTLPPASPFVGWNGNTAPAGPTGFVPGTWPTKYGMSPSNDYARGGAGDPGGDIDPTTGDHINPADGGSGGMTPVPWKHLDTITKGGGFSSGDERRDFTLGYARSRGVDPRLVNRVVGSEGGWDTYDTTGDGGKSFGPFQDYTGGGVGNELQAKGVEVDPSKPGFDERRVLKANVDYIADHGASPDVFHGLRGSGGIGGSGAVTIPARQTAQAAASMIPQQQWGSLSLASAAQAIEKANPGLDPAVKFMALAQIEKLIAPEERTQMQLLLAENRNAMQLALKDITIQNQQELLRQRQTFTQDQTGNKAGQGGQIIQQDGKTFQVHPDGTVTEIKLPGQGPATRLGSSSQGTVPPEAQKFMAEAIANYQLPPLTGWVLKSPSGQATMAQVMQLNPQYDATQYTGKQSGARAMGTRSANLTMATNVAEQMIPLVRQTSHALDAMKTQFPTLNSLALAVEKGTGDENVVRFMEQLNTLKYVYARALNPTGVARIQDLQRFDEIIDKAWTTGQIDAALDQIQQSLKAERRGVDQSIGGGGKSGAAPQSSGSETMPTPQELSSAPDGSTVRSPTGELWIKNGSTLTKAPSGAVEVPPK